MHAKGNDMDNPYSQLRELLHLFGDDGFAISILSVVAVICFHAFGFGATYERVAVPAPPRTMAFPRSFLVLTETRVFPAIMSLRTLLMSVLVRSLKRQANVGFCSAEVSQVPLGDKQPSQIVVLRQRPERMDRSADLWAIREPNLQLFAATRATHRLTMRRS
jgi:hypothetical protein